MKISPSYLSFFVGAFLVLANLSCSTEKDALLNKGYHNMTARFNGYFNAGIIIDESLKSYRNTYPEDYEKIIPLDIYPGQEDATGLFPELDDAIERCETVIVRHSMPNPQVVTNKEKENCRWIDDNWLVIGQAHYIKREYEAAKQKLNYVADTYRGEVSIYEAQIWLAKTHIAMGEYPEAKRILTLVEKSIENAEEKQEKQKEKRPKSKLQRQRAKKNKVKEDKGPAPFPKRLKLDYEIAMAELFIAQEENKKAIVHLENGIKVCRNKKRRARYMFALAQLYSNQGNNSQASYYYNKVSKSNAPYEMQFKARIRKALTSTGNSGDLKKELDKMLKDGKNFEYKDQIYYALAEIDLKKPDVEAAKKNYSNSVLWSVNNDRQKGVSYLRLADIHFEEKNYVDAQRYYDSCVQVLPKDHDGYEKLKNKAAGLSELVVNYETVEREDSLQKISFMSEKERKKFLEKTIKDIEAEKARKEAEAERRLLAQQSRVNLQQTTRGNGNKWYFYNSKQVAAGFNEFRGLWGQRKLEDNWRRADKSTIATFDEENGEVESDSTEAEGLTVEELLKDVPLTPEAIDSSNNLILNSLYNLGIIYKEQLKEEAEAISYFNQVIDRKVEHPKVLPALYQLYLISKKKGDSKAENYKKSIIKNYSDSEIAQILIDPDYLKKKELKDREELNAYSSAFRDYRQRRYGVVITKSNKVINEDTSNAFVNKYYLLKAFAISKLDAGNKEAISKPLEELYAKAPTTEEGKQAKKYLDQIKSGQAIVDPDEQKVESPYIFEENSKYIFLLTFPAQAGNINPTKVKVSNFNSEFFRKDELKIKNAPVGNKYQILTVRSFKDLTKAKIYLTTFTSDRAKDILGTTAEDYEIALISTKNLSELFKTKDIEGYFEFYDANY